MSGTDAKISWVIRSVSVHKISNISQILQFLKYLRMILFTIMSVRAVFFAGTIPSKKYIFLLVAIFSIFVKMFFWSQPYVFGVVNNDMNI